MHAERAHRHLALLAILPGMPASSKSTLAALCLGAALLSCSGGDSTAPPNSQAGSFFLMSGDLQTGGAGENTPDPLIVKVLDHSGKVLPGATVNAVVTSGGGSVSSPSYTTDDRGLVQILWSLGTHLKLANHLEITVAALPALAVSATVDVPAGVHLIPAATPPPTLAGQPLADPIVIQVTVADGRPLVGADTHWRMQLANSESNPCPCGAPEDSVTDETGRVRGHFTMPADPHGALLITSRVLSPNAIGGAVKSVQVPLTFLVSRLFTTIVSGFDHSCALAASGAAYCWGYNGSGVTADGGEVGSTSGLPTSRPLPVDGTQTFAHLALGGFHSCGLSTGGQLYCWGDNRAGEYGDGTVTSHPSPTLVPTSQAFVALAAGRAFTCGLIADGTAYCWGRNTDGALGDGTKIDRLTPTPVAGGLHFSSIVAMEGHGACALDLLGHPYCWGSNDTGRLGDGTTVDHLTPQLVAGGHQFTQLMGASDHACGLTSAGAAWCWGDNSAGQIGDGTVTTRLTPTAVAGGITFQSLATGMPAFFSCGLSTAGTAYCWGDNYLSELGLTDLLAATLPVCHGPGFNVYCSLVPLPVFGPHVFTQLSLNLFSVCGQTVAEGAYCWGDDSYGENGDTFTLLINPSPSLVASPAAPGVASIASMPQRTGGARGSLRQSAPSDRSGRAGGHVVSH